MIHKVFLVALGVAAIYSNGASQNKDPLKTEIVTADIANFWAAFDAAKPEFKPEIFQKLYIDKGTKGLRDFTKLKIKNSENLARAVSSHAKYYESIRKSTDSINGMGDQIRRSLARLKDLYPRAIFPPVYFVVGALSSGGTASKSGLLIGAEMYGLTDQTPREELNAWLNSVIKPVWDVPHIVAHELVHFQQNYDGRDLLSACIKEGAADFIAELISGKHINGLVHDYANAHEEELWLEFKLKMSGKDWNGWLYSSTGERPNDIGYWMGYQITKSYYEQVSDKVKAVDDILNIRDFDEFLAQSKYAEKFK